jgi:predicted transcriptional regulator
MEGETYALKKLRELNEPKDKTFFDVKKLPEYVLHNAVKLTDPLRRVYLALYTAGPSSTTQIGSIVNRTRADVCYRINTLVDLGIVKEYAKEGRRKLYVVIPRVEMVKSCE